MTFEISEDAVTFFAHQCHRVMEDREACTVEQVRDGIVATLPYLVAGFLGSPEELVGDIIEARPSQFNQALGLPFGFGSTYLGNTAEWY